MEEGGRLEMCPISRQEGYVELQRVEGLGRLDDENGCYIRLPVAGEASGFSRLVATSSLLLGLYLIDTGL